MNKSKCINKEKLLFMFNSLDFDNSGYIDKLDLENVILSYGERILNRDDIDFLFKQETNFRERIYYTDLFNMLELKF